MPMANILLTTNCNLSCEFCFARERIQKIPRQNMSMSNIEKVIQFLKHSNFPNLRLMGGEPTLHPQFEEIVKMGLHEGFHIDLLSNGTWKEKYNNLFSGISPEHISFLLNVNHPDKYTKVEWQTIQNNLFRLNCRNGVSLSFNIVEIEPEYEYIFDLTQQYGIKQIRLSFSLPIIGRNNRYIELADYKSAVPFIMKFVNKCRENNVSVCLDNAIPLCIFSYEEIGQLILEKVLDLSRNVSCEPVIDIGPDLTIWYCFCLSGIYNKKLDDFDNLEEIVNYYHQITRPMVNSTYSMKECVNCTYKETWNCQGGCLAFSYKALEQSENNYNVKYEPSSDWDEEGILILEKNTIVQKYTLPDEHYMLRNIKTGAEVEILSSFSILVSMLDGNCKAKDIIKNLAQENMPHDQSEFDLFESEIKSESIKNILSGFIKAELLEYKSQE